VEFISKITKYGFGTSHTSSLKMETVFFSEKLVSTYVSTRRYNPEEHRHLHRRENLKSHISYGLLNLEYDSRSRPSVDVISVNEALVLPEGFEL
jgi:hypothetical protein